MRGFLDALGKKIYRGVGHTCCHRGGAFRIWPYASVL